ncbi:MAG: uracil phosphoribosyltransferase [Planctomycetes bacterium]|nr:uracil phosphoribosyltransferase [Planctomycetota bacterium]
MLTHHYGPDVLVFDDAYLATLLAVIGSPETGTAQLPALVRAGYRRLLQEVLAREFPVREQQIPTRMAAIEPRAFVRGPQLCRETRLVICAVIRAGILPAQACYEAAIEVLPPANVRLDFLNLSRTTDADHHVTGVRLDGSKIGGPVDGAVVLIPDPMGATGGTVVRAVDIYQGLAGGPPHRIVAAHLMVTPEAITRVTGSHPGVRLYAGRVDRGLSSDRALRSPPGAFPHEERGLNDVQYIVPGAGGMGELLTNSWV